MELLLTGDATPRLLAPDLRFERLPQQMLADLDKLALNWPRSPARTWLYDRPMCRVLAYLGEPIALADVLFKTDSSLVRQSYNPRMMATFLNLAGFGMVAWDPQSVRAEQPFAYRVATLPAFDRNLRSLAAKLAPTCLVAHVRGVTDSEHETVADTNLHPFRFHGARVALAHNGHLREFARMRYDLVPHIKPELAQRIEGTTDSEWIYALVLSQLDDPFGLPGTRELADATASALRLLREIRERHGIDTSSPANLFLTTGEALVVLASLTRILRWVRSMSPSGAS